MTPELVLLSRVAYRDREITGPRLRGLLAVLAGDLRTGVSTGRLVDGLWPDEQPDNPTKAVQVLVSRARAQLGAEVIANTATGYRLALTDDQVDASAVLLSATTAARHARAGDHGAALASADAGLALCEGLQAGDAALDDPLATLRAERAETRASLARARAIALSRLGRHAEAVEALTALFAERTRDEELLLELLRSEAATAGPAAALARYDAYRRAIRDELGTDPGGALQAVYRTLLDGETPAVRHGVPHEPNPLLGRADDLAGVARLLRTSRVTSIVGPGGLGKTRLAHAVSREAEQRTVHFVPLAGVTSDDDVAGEVASALGAGHSALAAPTGLLGAVVNALGAGPVLLVLDNCEHVIRGAAELVRALVSMTGELRVLTTSRAPLGISSESVYALPELELSTTVELFGQRARATRAGVDLPADVVAELCRHLDGLPLAVELAAARVRVMSVPEIARRLDDRFALLRGGARDAPRRHHTLHAVVDWSWHLLEAQGQAALRALSVFPDGFTAAAAECLVPDAFDLIEHLVDQSLLKVVDTGAGVRFRMLETVREFSATHREAAGETERAIDGYLTWAREFGLAHHESVIGERPFEVAERLRPEQDNLVQALRHGLDRDDAPTVVATAAVLAALWTVDSNYARVATLAGETAGVLSHYRPAPAMVEATRTIAVLSALNTYLLQGPRATRALAVALRLPPAPPDTAVRAMAAVSGARDEAALTALCDRPEPLLAGVANGVACQFVDRRHGPAGALPAARRMLDALDRASAPWLTGLAHGRLGELCLQLERGADARAHALAALALLGEHGPRAEVTSMHLALVLTELQRGAFDEAERWLELATTESSGDDEVYGLATFRHGVRAEIRLAGGEIEAGLRLWRRAADLAENADRSGYRLDAPELDPWILQAQAVTVVAHARHGRLDQVTDLVERLPGRLVTLLENPIANPPPSLMELPAAGTVVLALAMVDLDRGAHRSGARLVALAERFHYAREFQPTMSSAAARAAASVGGAAYAEAVAEFAALGNEEARAAALAELALRAG